MKDTFKVYECDAILERDRTSFGNQFSVRLEGNVDEEIWKLSDFENKQVRVIVLIPLGLSKEGDK